MHDEIERAVLSYEHGHMTRRQLVGRLAALALASSVTGPRAAGQESAPTFKATGLNHIALHTPDVQVSRDFYVKHLGMEVSRESESSCFLTCGNEFVAFFRADQAELDHYCYSIDNYDVDAVEEKLKSANLNPRRSGSRIYFNDPHGITVQLAAGEHGP